MTAEKKGETKMENSTKRKMSMKRFLAIMIPLLVLLTGVIIAVTAVMNYWKVVMNQVFGYPEIIVKDLEGTENWDADYYGKKNGSKEKADNNAAVVAEEAEKEGIVLLKNKDNALPLTDVSESSRKTVNAFGWSFYYPVNGGGGSGSVGADGLVSPEQCLNEVGIDINQTLKTAYGTWSENNKTKWGNKASDPAARPNITSAAFGIQVSWDIPEMNASDIASATASGTSKDSVVWIAEAAESLPTRPVQWTSTEARLRATHSDMIRRSTISNSPKTKKR